MAVTPEDKIVAYATPLTPQPKTKMKIGSKIKFNTFVRISNTVGVFEFPSACKVFAKKLENINTNEHKNIGVKYCIDNSIEEAAPI